MILGFVGGIFHLVLLAGAVASFYLWNWWPLILSVAAYAAVELFIIKYAQLKALSETQIRKERLGLAIFAAIFVLLVLVVGMLS